MKPLTELGYLQNVNSARDDGCKRENQDHLHLFNAPTTAQNPKSLSYFFIYGHYEVWTRKGLSLPHEPEQPEGVIQNPREEKNSSKWLCLCVLGGSRVPNLKAKQVISNFSTQTFRDFSEWCSTRPHRKRSHLSPEWTLLQQSRDLCFVNDKQQIAPLCNAALGVHVLVIYLFPWVFCRTWDQWFNAEDQALQHCGSRRCWASNHLQWGVCWGADFQYSIWGKMEQVVRSG